MSQNNIVEKITEYIEAHLEEELSLDKIAGELNYSKFYIARFFAEKTGCTVYKYIQGRRMTVAAKKLAETEKPIVEVAYEACYNSQQAFTVAFHQIYGCTPQMYRRNGVFYPAQTRIRMEKSGDYLWGGRMAA